MSLDYGITGDWYGRGDDGERELQLACVDFLVKEYGVSATNVRKFLAIPGVAFEYLHSLTPLQCTILWVETRMGAYGSETIYD